MAIGTGFVNFQKMLGANMPYKQQVQSERDRASAAVDDYTKRFSNIESDYGGLVSRAAGHLSKISPLQTQEFLDAAGMASDPSVLSSKALTAAGVYKPASELASSFRPGTGSSGVVYTANPNTLSVGNVDTSGFSSGASGYEGGISNLLTGAAGEKFNTNVNKVGTSGERALDRAIYGNMYDTEDNTWSNYASALPESVKSQFSGIRSGVSNIDTWRKMLMGL